MRNPTDLYLRVRALMDEVPDTGDEAMTSGAPGTDAGTGHPTAEWDGAVRLEGTGSPSRARMHLRRTCAAAVRGLEVDGAGICLWSGEGGLVTAAASDERSARVEELQFVVGEGPCLTAFARRAPVLVPDLADVEAVSWTAYQGPALELGVRAVFAFPLHLGGARLGVLDVYRHRPGPLAPEAIPLALTFAEVAFLDLVEEVSDTGAAQSLADSAAANRYEVYQAQGMVMVQLGLSAEDALLRLRAHAFAHDVPLVDLARGVIQRRVTLEGHDDGGT